MSKKARSAQYRPYFAAAAVFFMFLILSLAYGFSFVLPNGLHTFLILITIGVIMSSVIYLLVGPKEIKVLLFLLVPYISMSILAVLFVYGFGTKPIAEAEDKFPEEQSDWSIVISADTRSEKKIHIDLLPDYDTRQRHLVMNWEYVNLRHIAAAEIEDEKGQRLVFPCAQFRNDWQIITPKNPRFKDFVVITKDGNNNEVFTVPGAQEKKPQSLSNYQWLAEKLNTS